MLGFRAVLDSPIGKLGIDIQNNCLIGIQFLSSQYLESKPVCPLSKEVACQLAAYFDKKLTSFDLPLELDGSSYMNSVYQLVNLIPYGKTVTYSDIAKQLASGPRAVGNACRRNPIPIIVPCHRVVAKNNLGGYSGLRSGPVFEIKTFLLSLEEHIITDNGTTLGSS